MGLFQIWLEETYADRADRALKAYLQWYAEEKEAGRTPSKQEFSDKIRIIAGREDIPVRELRRKMAERKRMMDAAPPITKTTPPPQEEEAQSRLFDFQSPIAPTPVRAYGWRVE